MQIFNNTSLKEVHGTYETRVSENQPLSGLNAISAYMQGLRMRTSFIDVPISGVHFVKGSVPGPANMSGSGLVAEFFGGTPILMPHANEAIPTLAIPSKGALATILSYAQFAGVAGARKALDFVTSMPVEAILPALEVALREVERYGDERARAATNIKARIVTTPEGIPVVTQFTKAGYFFDGMDLLIGLAAALKRVQETKGGIGLQYLQDMRLDRARYTDAGYLSTFIGWDKGGEHVSRWITANGYGQSYKVGLDIQGGPASTIRIGLGVQGGACRNTYRIMDNLFEVRHTASGVNGTEIVTAIIYGMVLAMTDGALSRAHVEELEGVKLDFDFGHPLDLFERAAQTTLDYSLADSLFEGFVNKYDLDPTGRNRARTFADAQGGLTSVLGFANMVTAVAHEPEFALSLDAAIDAERTGGAMIVHSDSPHKLRRLFDVKVEQIEDWVE